MLMYLLCKHSLSLSRCQEHRGAWHRNLQDELLICFVYSLISLKNTPLSVCHLSGDPLWYQFFHEPILNVHFKFLFKSWFGVHESRGDWRILRGKLVYFSLNPLQSPREPLVTKSTLKVFSTNFTFNFPLEFTLTRLRTCIKGVFQFSFKVSPYNFDLFMPFSFSSSHFHLSEPVEPSPRIAIILMPSYLGKA